ncbi:MAG: molybdenum cofactor guanylyltransferase MobA [Candidatus Methylopumilus sp.]|jgi:molybdopterin-guanine dinucleotide biosynthesis protein A
MQITGVILAGGQSRRMEGKDKGLVNFLGQPMVTHVITRLKPQVSEIFINANRETERYAEFGYPVIADDIGGFAGPLAGLHKAMKVANTPYILTVPCDSPLLPSDLTTRLMNGLIERDADIAVAKTGSQTHPVFCLCRKSLLGNLEQYLLSGERKVDRWQKSLEIIEIAFNDNPQAFSNINTADELAMLEKAA